MKGTRKSVTMRPALLTASVLAALVGWTTIQAWSADAGGFPTARLMAQAGSAPASQAPAATGQPAPAPAATTTQPPREVEARITELHQRLQITPAQEPQFKAYADVLRANAEKMQAVFDERAKQTDMSAPARLRWVAHLTEVHGENLNKLVPVFDALYQSLSDQQKKAADTFFDELRQRRAARRGR